MDSEYKLYLDYSATEFTKRENEVLICKIYYDEKNDCFMEYNHYCNEIIPFK
jgi:hypothetical protein